MNTVRHLTASVKPALQSLAPALAVAALLSALGLSLAPVNAHAESSADDLDVLRVDLPLHEDSVRNGELRITDLISENTYIDVEDFNLRAVELEAHTTREGEVRLKVGRYVTPRVPLPGPDEEGLLRIEAPHKTNKAWRLLMDGRVTVTALTAVLEPRNENVAYYESRYSRRGYAFSNDPYYRKDWRYQSRTNAWPYSWLRSDYDYNRRASHWLWLNDSRARFRLNPSYGFNHRHTRNCYDRYGRHLSFNGHQRRYRTGPVFQDRTSRLQRNGRYLHERRADRREAISEDRARTERRRSIEPTIRSTRRGEDQRQSKRDILAQRRNERQINDRARNDATQREQALRAQRQRTQDLRNQQQRAQQQRIQQQRVQQQRKQQQRRAEQARREAQSALKRSGPSYRERRGARTDAARNGGRRSAD